MSGLSLVFEPTFPLFFGDTRELSPIMAPESKLLPSIYTMAGAAMTLLRARGFETTTLEKIISEGRLKIMGPYIRVRGRAYVPAPRYLVKIRKDGTEEIQSVSIVEELWIESSLIRKVGYLSDNKAEYHEGFLVPLDSLPNPSPSDVVEIKKEPRERLGIALDRQRRTAREGLMYTKVEFEWLSVDDEAPKFCIDLCGHEELLEGLRSAVELAGLTRLGGEGCVASVSVGKAELAPKAKDPEPGRTYLAVSHIRAEPSERKLYAWLSKSRCELKWSIGTIEPISGWLMRERKPKHTLAALAPGSVFRTGEITKGDADVPWYYRLLGTILEVDYPSSALAEARPQ